VSESDEASSAAALLLAPKPCEAGAKDMEDMPCVEGGWWWEEARVAERSLP
jgi:hypothetical protein